MAIFGGLPKIHPKYNINRKKDVDFYNDSDGKTPKKLFCGFQKKTENMCYLGIAEPHVCRVIIKKTRDEKEMKTTKKKTNMNEKKNYINFSAILKATSKCWIQSVLCAKHTYKYNKVIW